MFCTAVVDDPCHGRCLDDGRFSIVVIIIVVLKQHGALLVERFTAHGPRGQ
jgi:hypothetical protein